MKCQQRLEQWNKELRDEWAVISDRSGTIHCFLVIEHLNIIFY